MTMFEHCFFLGCGSSTEAVRCLERTGTGEVVRGGAGRDAGSGGCGFGVSLTLDSVTGSLGAGGVEGRPSSSRGWRDPDRPIDP